MKLSEIMDNRPIPPAIPLASVNKEFMRVCVANSPAPLRSGSYFSRGRQCGCLDGVVVMALTGLNVDKAADAVYCTDECYPMATYEAMSHISGVHWVALAAMDVGFESGPGTASWVPPGDTDEEREHARRIRREAYEIRLETLGPVDGLLD